jgi:anti-anti-sigma factor
VTMPPLTVTITREGRVCVLSVSGELDIATTPALTQQAAAALRLPAERLIIDLSGLQFIDCCGVRALAAVTRAAPPGCPVLVRGAGRRVSRILNLLAVSLERRGTVTLERVAGGLCQQQGPGRPVPSGPRPPGRQARIHPARRRRGVGGRSAVGDRELLDAVDPAGTQADGVAGLADVRHGVGDRVEDQLDLQFGQAGAQAVVRAQAAEPQVGVRVAGDVEPLGMLAQ